jgi:hypothetical protein
MKRHKRHRWGVQQRLPCETCNRPVATYLPRGGDGTALRVRPHQTPDKADCDGQYAKGWAPDA